MLSIPRMCSLLFCETGTDRSHSSTGRACRNETGEAPHFGRIWLSSQMLYPRLVLCRLGILSSRYCVIKVLRFPALGLGGGVRFALAACQAASLVGKSSTVPI